MYLLLIGAPGAGKGTQATALAEALKIGYIASGDLFRENIKNDTDLGKLAQGYMDRGELVPDDVTVRMVLDRVARPDMANGAVLDGFPRTVTQAEALDAALASQGKTIDEALYIKVGLEELLRRLTGRWICRTCGTPYHIVSKPPRTEGVCDLDGGELYQRTDDSIETARHRLGVYFEQTMPMIEYFRSQQKLREINGEAEIGTVRDALLRAVGAAAA